MYNALQKVDVGASLVCIHDVARPLVTKACVYKASGVVRGLSGVLRSLAHACDDFVVAFFVPPLERSERCLPVLIFSPVMSRSCLQWCTFEVVFIVLSDLPDPAR